MTKQHSDDVNFTTRSWIASANLPTTDFPLANLPYGVFSRRSGPKAACRVGVAIGDFVLDIAEAWPELVPGDAMLGVELFEKPSLNAFLAEGREVWQLVRNRLQAWLGADAPELRDNEELKSRVLIPMSQVQMHLPVEIGNYTDFYASEHHATNVGSMFRPDNPLLPNWKYLPVGYHGRASSIVVSGTDVIRPCGQSRADDADRPSWGPSRLLDYELEVGFITGPGNEHGRRIRIADAPNHIFGLVLVNDWSARDIQKWEYQPLGPFLAKSFATTISPWVVPLDALLPFRTRTCRQAGDPQTLPYLDGAWDWGLDIRLQVAVQSAEMQRQGMPGLVTTDTNFRHMYWNICHQLAHQASNGCNVRPGDLYASGTVSGPEKESRGCLLERCWRGTEPLELPTGEKRAFLADGDAVSITGWCGGDARHPIRVGFGSCDGTILPALMNDDAEVRGDHA